MSSKALRKLIPSATRSNPALVQVLGSRCHISDLNATVKDAPNDLAELELSSLSLKPQSDDEKIKRFDPVQRSEKRRRQLPSSRYQYRSPRYYRGPLHPHQPPPKTDPASREFIPGPFSYTRLDQTYQSTIAADLMTMMYVHKQPGIITPPRADRLRTWDESSPYHKGRPKRGPRGPGEVLSLTEKDIHWRNIPRIEEITIHSFVKDATNDVAYLHVAGMLIQTLTGVRAQVHEAKRSVSAWKLRQGVPIALSVTLSGDTAYEFLDKCIHLVFPKLKDWRGVAGTTGDSSGNLAWGFNPEGVILFPEVAINYDMYPPKMIPGFHMVVKTSATSDRQARLLLAALGVPFYGKMVD
ncbi:unnamed protein product [Blumeria hordei]|uniref:Large ribosomal subunit protein uL5m n=1 Tax=Blumeria hordei TaxID=2867405 RepID=A0A383UPK2_BLUHO|nr:unnamed protein product [Blumeria hordei]